MTLEACLICVDNSEHMRNGDFLPTRFDAQHEAVSMIAGAKTQAHPENGVGVLAMASASKRVEVLVNLTSEIGEVLTNLHKARIGGDLNFTSSINVARLALKHRQNRNQQQRIVIFVGSPIEETSEQLVSLGKKLKKNNVALDIVNFGQETDNTEKLEALVKTVDRDGNSHIVTVPPGPHVLSDILISSPILQTADGEAPVINPMGGDMDADLEMALRLSMEEHQREESRRQQEAAGEGGAPAETPAASAAPPMDQMMMDEDEEMRLAIEMSLAEANQAAPAETSAPAEAPSQDYVQSVLESLPGVDTSDPRVQEALRQLEQDETMEDATPEGDGEKKE